MNTRLLWRLEDYQAADLYQIGGGVEECVTSVTVDLTRGFTNHSRTTVTATMTPRDAIGHP